MTSREEYEHDLHRRQSEHLAKVKGISINYNGKVTKPWVACAHDQCPSCVGTGIKADGESCVHCLTCYCPKCVPWFA